MKMNNKGMSLLVVMAALIVVGFIGTSLIKMSFSDTIGGVLYSESGAARDAANSGITAAIHELNVDIAVDPTALSEVLFRLNAYMDLDKPNPRGADSTICFLKGSPTTWEYLTSDLSQGYRVYIDGFEFVNDHDCKLSLVSEGFSDGGGRATTVALYSITDLYRIPSSNWNDMSAIYMEDDVAIDFKAPIVVNGDVYLSAKTTWDAGATQSYFNGKFRTQTVADPDEPMDFQGEFIFNGNTYFGKMPVIKLAANVSHNNTRQGLINDVLYANANWGDTGSFVINADVGFRHGVWIGTPNLHYYGTNGLSIPSYLKITGESYWIGWLGAVYGDSLPADQNVSWADFGGKTVTYNGWFDYSRGFYKNQGASNFTSSLSEESILTQLGFPVNPCELVIHPEIIPDSLIKEINDGLGGSTDQLTGRMLNSYTPNWNGFAVIKCDGNVDVIDSSSVATGHVITNKVILLVPTSTQLQPSSVGSFAGKIPPVKIVKNPDGSINRAQSGHLTIINTGGIVKDFGGTDSYRGLLYAQSGQTTIGGACNAGADGLYGSLYASTGGTYTWHPQRASFDGVGAKNAITFDPTVFEDLDVTDDAGNPFIEKVGCDASSDPSAGELTADKIDPRFISQAL